MEIYESHKMEDPRLPFILHSFHYGRGEALPFSNWHENIELLYFTKGKAIVTINAQRISVKKGDIVVVNANYLHGIVATEPCHFYCLIVDRSFCLANHFDTSRIQFSPCVKDTELCALIDSFVDEYNNRSFSYRVQILRATGLRICSLLCGNHSTMEEEPDGDSLLLSSIKKTLSYIHANSHRKISLDKLAEVSGMSKYYLAREFHRITGYTVVSYINHFRCENAKRMLVENEMSIAAIARACGFPNASYFSRSFLSIVGILPSQYREEALTTEQKQRTKR